MAYTPTTPTGPGENPSESQPKITANFEDISLLVNVNHVDFNGANQGKHKFLTMPEQDPTPATGDNEGSIYTKEFGLLTQLFWRGEDAAADGPEQQLTNSVPNELVPVFPDTDINWDWDLANGLQLRFGIVLYDAIDKQFDFSTPFKSSAYIVTLTPIGGAALAVAWNTQFLDTIGFKISSATLPVAGKFQYLAIGS